MSEKFIIPKTEQVPEEEKGTESVEEISFDELNRGDQLEVTISARTEPKTYKITIVGKRKNGLLVEVNYGDRNYRALMPGGFTKFGPGVTERILKVANEDEENCLYFKNAKDLKTGNRTGRIRTSQIEKIALFRKEETKK